MAVEQVIKISLDDLKALGGIDNLKKSLGETEQSTKSLKQQFSMLLVVLLLVCKMVGRLQVTTCLLLPSWVLLV